MSGSGGGSGRISIGGGGGGGGDSSTDCGSLIVETTLNSPVSAVVSLLKKDDRLTVEIQVGASGINSLVAKRGGQIAGSLTPPSLITILNCIQGGFQYVAIVLNDVTGGVVRVRIQAP